MTATTPSKRCSPNSVQKFNPNHDRMGRFSSGPGGGPEIPDMVGYMSQGMIINENGKVVPDGSHQRRVDGGRLSGSDIRSFGVPGHSGYYKMTSKEKKLAQTIIDNEELELEIRDSTDALGNSVTSIHGRREDYGIFKEMWNMVAPSTFKKSDIIEIEDVTKFNPYHGADGRFSSANTAASFTYSPGKSKAHDLAISREKERQSAVGGMKPAQEKPKAVSATSTGGKLVDDGSGNLYGENDNGYSASVLDGGKSDINFYRYGSRQVYEVSYNSDSKVGIKPKTIVSTKKEAKQLANDWLKQTKDYDPAYEYDADGNVHLPF